METKEKRISAIVDASFTVGICPDLLHLVEVKEGGKTGLSSPSSEGSCSSLAACRSPIIMGHHAVEGFPSETSSPSPAELNSPDSVFKSPRSPSLTACRSPLGRKFPSGASSPSPAGLNSPDSVFKSPKSSSKFGFFSAIKGRRVSAPVTQHSPRREVRFFKSDLLAIPEQNVDRRWSTSVGHAPVRVVVSSSEAEFGGGKLRRRREFGSTGDLLEGSSQFKSSKQFLGKSMEQVSDCIYSRLLRAK